MHIENENVWMEYAISAWRAVGNPSGLDPHLVLNDPIAFDQFYYKYFEQRYIDMWLALYSRVNPISGALLKRESDIFRKSWQRNFSWETVWKQTLPLFVYGTALGAKNEVLVELASWYCLGQAIPSMVIDRILDSNTTESSVSDAAFCVLSYAKALQGLRSMKLPCIAALENIFVNLTGEMYDKMLIENSRRYESFPNFIVDAVRDYLLPNSRLLSSIFFAILPVWAHILANKVPSEQMIESMSAMRKVRQLNDEILDVYEDICHGLLTLPWLYAIEEEPDLRNKIRKLWEGKDIANSETFIECQQIFCKSSARKRTALESLKFLSQSMRITTESFSINTAFEITLLHNIRWTLLNWLEKVDYDRDTKTIREPLLPEKTILDTANPIEPIPGGGVVVVNGLNQVLMTLVLKRGMLRWELPAGVAKDGESMEEAAKREALEETGKHIAIGEVIAMCWHHSRKLNKGWMGIIFQGKLIDADSSLDFRVVTPQAFAHGKFNIHVTPELYRSIKPTECDFEEILRLCNNIYSTAHESVVDSGFVDWKKIPSERMHPLHRKLLETYEAESHCMELLVSDADRDFESYDAKSKLYYKN